MIYDDTGGTFKEVLQLSKTVSVHHKNMQILITEVHKILNNIYPSIMKIFFSFGEKQIQLQNFKEMKHQKK